QGSCAALRNYLCGAACGWLARKRTGEVYGVNYAFNQIVVDGTVEYLYRLFGSVVKTKSFAFEPLIIERRQMQTSVSLVIIPSLVELYSTA
ncbi:MAG TPA: hypothetical protein PLG04_08770, partial [Anaerolineaceae bacterium]|nr:hypothetical protein [Anaerolineaceae bacterium]